MRFIAKIFLVLILLFSKTVVSQHADCKSAYVYKDILTGPIDVLEGFGDTLEIFGHSITSPYYFTKEHHTVWVKLVFTKDNDFTFDIRPMNETDDYDFIIFKAEDSNFCESINVNKTLPVRTNLCQKKPGERSVTGLRQGFENNFAKAGKSPSFSSSLPVKKGETYYLVLDAPYGAKDGFNIDLRQDVFVEKQMVSEPKQTDTIVAVEPQEENTPKIYFQLVGDSSNTLSTRNVQIKGLKEENKIHFNEKNQLVIDHLTSPAKYTFIITEKGYLQKRVEFMQYQKPKDTLLIVHLDKLKLGDKLQFENILFVGNKADILPDSKEDLEKLTLFLKNNSNIKVEIGGHVNAKGHNKGRYKSLSKARAKAVYDYLTEKGIKPSQLSYKGYGNSQMIYAKPATEMQSQMNRRVELTITGIE